MIKIEIPLSCGHTYCDSSVEKLKFEFSTNSRYTKYDDHKYNNSI